MSFSCHAGARRCLVCKAAVLLAAACVGVVAGTMLEAATGFGFSLVAAPLLFAAIEPEPAVVMLLLLGLEVNVLPLATERRRPRPLPRSTAMMLAFSLPGALAGVAVLRALPAGGPQGAGTPRGVPPPAPRPGGGGQVPPGGGGAAGGGPPTATPH